MEQPPGKIVQQSEAERSHFAGIDMGGENAKRVFLKIESSGIPKASGCEEQLWRLWFGPHKAGVGGMVSLNPGFRLEALPHKKT